MQALLGVGTRANNRHRRCAARYAGHACTPLRMLAARHCRFVCSSTATFNAARCNSGRATDASVVPYTAWGCAAPGRHPHVQAPSPRILAAFRSPGSRAAIGFGACKSRPRSIDSIIHRSTGGRRSQWLEIGRVVGGRGVNLRSTGWLLQGRRSKIFFPISLNG
jgi:hypothetical protein